MGAHRSTDIREVAGFAERHSHVSANLRTPLLSSRLPGKLTLPHTKEWWEGGLRSPGLQERPPRPCWGLSLDFGFWPSGQILTLSLMTKGLTPQSRSSLVSLNLASWRSRPRIASLLQGWALGCFYQSPEPGAQIRNTVPRGQPKPHLQASLGQPGACLSAIAWSGTA